MPRRPRPPLPRGSPELVTYMRRVLAPEPTRQLSLRQLATETNLARRSVREWSHRGPPLTATYFFAGVLLKRGRTREALEVLELFS
jgi:hypothetical protein